MRFCVFESNVPEPKFRTQVPRWGKSLLTVILDVFVSAFAILLLVTTGSAVLALSSKGRQVEGLTLLAYSVAFGIICFALLGAVIVSLPSPYGINARIALGGVLVFSVLQCWRRNVLARLWAGCRRWTLLGLSSWASVACLALGASLVPVTMPNPLPDGAYVIKNENLHVKIQRILGDFPADNYIPFVAAEFLLRDIQFAKERPLMPGQELSNRPILLSLATIPIHAALYPPSPRVEPLPKFRYVGTRWPNVGILGDNVSYRTFLRLAVVFNAALILGFVLVLQRLKVPIELATLSCVVYATSPYFLGQTLFAWPKSLGGFFLILSGLMLLKRHHYYVAGILAGAAYWSHPYAVVYCCCFFLYLICSSRSFSFAKQSAVPFTISLSLILIPWFIWTRIYLQIPSDLVSQNLHAASLYDAVVARLLNLRDAFFPMPISWTNPDAWAQIAIVGMVGAVGPFVVVQALLGGLQAVRRAPMEGILLAALPCSMLIAVFGVRALPALHGLQPLAAVLLAISFWWMYMNLPKRTAMCLGVAQISINLLMIAYRVNALSMSV